MRLPVVIAVFAFSLSVCGQTPSTELSPKQKEKANRNAELEIKNLPKKGWEVNRPDISFEDMLRNAWKLKFAMDGQTPVYIYTFGNGSGKTKEEAFTKASTKAKAQLPGLILMYYNMWNMAVEIPQKEKDLIAAAISKSENKIPDQLEILNHKPMVNMFRVKGSKTEIHLRYYYSQMKCREIARELIMTELEKTSDWSRKKMISVLTYDK